MVPTLEQTGSLAQALQVSGRGNTVIGAQFQGSATVTDGIKVNFGSENVLLNPIFPNPNITTDVRVASGVTFTRIVGGRGTAASLAASNIVDAGTDTVIELLADAKLGTFRYAADAGVVDDYVITPVPAVSAYVTGQVFHFKANTANTGAATLAVSGLAATAIKKLNDQALVTGDIEVGQIVTVVFDGTNFQMQSQLAQTPVTTTIATDPLWDALGDLVYGSGADTCAKLAGQITTTRKFLRQTGDGAVSAAPVWDTLVAADLTKVTNQSAGYTAVIGDFVLMSGTFTVTLPSAPADSSIIHVKNVGTGLVTVARGGADTIYTMTGAQTSFTIMPGEAYGMIYDTTNTRWAVY